MSSIDLSGIGINPKGAVKRNLDGKTLCDLAVAKGQGKYSKTGALLVYTGKHTGRSPQDRWLVKEASTENMVNWDKTHKPISEATFDILYSRITKYLSNLDELYVYDGQIGADPKTTKSVRVVNEYPHQNYFMNIMLRKASDAQLANFKEDFLILSAADLKVDDWAELGLASDAFIITHLAKNIVIVGGTHYAGERKKSAFSWLNFILPDMDVCPMHCSANVGKDGSTAIFFGLSGTGKTTLSADENRSLIGDDEHGWTADGTVFNMEGGCYAKGVNLSQKNEPIIWNAIKTGAVVENVVEKPGVNNLDLDFFDVSLTENSRIAYDLEVVPNNVESGIGKKVSTIVFLTADASGTLPPVARLSKAQAMYHYIAGYTSKVAGTEIGITEPVPNFSAYFGYPFFARMPMVYANSLAKRLDENPQATVYLINTGWNGQKKRISLPDTRTIVTAAIEGGLNDVEYTIHPIFKFEVPKTCPGLADSSLLDPVNSWSDKNVYWERANKLAEQFQANIVKFPGLTAEVLAAGPAPVKG